MKNTIKDGVRNYRNFLAVILVFSFLFLPACAGKTNPQNEIKPGPQEQKNQEQEDQGGVESSNSDAKEEYGITINDNSVSFIDGRGKEVTIEKNPKRVVVLFGSYIDLWLRNGGQMVGMVEDTSGEEIPGTEDIEKVGKFGSISLEKVISLEPDLVILSPNSKSQSELISGLEESNIPLLVVDYNFKEDYYRVVRLFSAINDREDLFEENGEKVRQEVDRIIEKAPKDVEPKVFIMFASSKSIASRGSDSTTGQMLKDLNAVNIADTAGELLSDKAFSLEKLLEEDPDFIFVQTMGSDMDKVQERIKADVESNPAWASLSAVKNDRYIFLPKDLYMYKANHRYPEAYEGLAKILYPEIFKVSSNK